MTGAGVMGFFMNPKENRGLVFGGGMAFFLFSVFTFPVPFAVPFPFAGSFPFAATFPLPLDFGVEVGGRVGDGAEVGGGIGDGAGVGGGVGSGSDD